MKEHIEKLRKEAEALTQKANLLELLLQDYPDLEGYENRWRREHFSSAKVNEVATEFESCHSCGCCSDSPLLIKPYVKMDDGTRIYSRPHEIVVGEKEPYRSGDLLYPDWEEKLKKLGLRQEIIDRVKYLGEPQELDSEEETE